MKHDCMTLEERKKMVAAKHAAGKPLDVNDHLVFYGQMPELDEASVAIRVNERTGRIEYWQGAGEPSLADLGPS